jgi:hypothetical protein
MMKLSWSDITVQQFLDIHRLSLTQDLDEMEKVERIICILFDKTEQEVENLTMLEFRELASQCGFILTGQIPGKPVRQIKVGKKRYSITYDPTKLRHRQYVEILHFGDKPVENMHLIMASIVQPVTWYRRKLRNEAEDHPAIASDMLNARVIDVYHACVFFCNLYVSLMENIKDSLVLEMMRKGATKDQAMALLNCSQTAMAGFIQPAKWQHLKV